ncbi:MAG: rod shape-determining protein, partial [Candidatus Liptonbacteria bacterium]
MKIFDSLFRDVGIDLGTANTLLYIKNKGITINEPSVVAINTKTNAIVAVGEEAKKMLGRTPAHLSVIRPLVNGVISDFDMTKEMLEHFLKKASAEHKSLTSYRRAVIAIPNNLTEVERKSVEDAAIVLSRISGRDKQDSTSMNVVEKNYENLLGGADISGLKVGVPKEYFESVGLDSRVRELVEKAIQKYKNLGAQIVDVSLPSGEL